MVPTDVPSRYEGLQDDMKTRRRGFGTIESLRSGRFRARYVDPVTGDRHSSSVTFTDHGDAEEWLNAERLKMERACSDLDRYESPKARASRRRETLRGMPTLRQYAEVYEADIRRRLRPYSVARYESVIRLYVLGRGDLADMRLNDISRRDVAQWWDGLPTTQTRRSCDQAYQVLHAMMNAAIEADLLTVNPVKVRGAGRASRRKVVRVITPDAVDRLAAAMPPHLRLAVILGAWCGLRVGEILELRLSDISRVDGLIQVRRAVTFVDGTAIIGPPKTDAGIRDVPVPATILRDDIYNHIHAFPLTTQDDLLFTHPETKQRITRSAFNGAYARAKKKAGLTLAFHDLRHVALTRLAQNGATLGELQTVAGHTTPTMAMRYQEASSDHLRSVFDKQDEAIRKARGIMDLVEYMEMMARPPEPTWADRMAAAIDAIVKQQNPDHPAQ